MEQVAESHADQQRGEHAAAGEEDVPGAPPPPGVVFAAVFESDPADDQCGQQQHDGQVHAGKHRRVPAGKRREHSGASHYEPDLVAVP